MEEPGRFCGWPANNGVWSWGDEILVGFTLAYYQEKELHHSVDESKPSLSVFARSLDGGMTWTVEDPEGYVGDGGKPANLKQKINFAHPNLVIRCTGQTFYYSYDRGKSWQFLSKAADTDMHKNNGNPPSLIRLADGRLVVTWGYRAVPYGIQARISPDNGKTWGEVIHLRDDARMFDFGYTRSVQRPDGKIVTIYYYTTEKNREQHIAATIWDPDQIQ